MKVKTADVMICRDCAPNVSQLVRRVLAQVARLAEESVANGCTADDIVRGLKTAAVTFETEVADET